MHIRTRNYMVTPTNFNITLPSVIFLRIGRRIKLPLLQYQMVPKSFYISCPVRYLYQTEFDIWTWLALLKISSNSPKRSVCDGGEGENPPIGQEILAFINKHPKVVKPVFYYLDRFSRNLAETNMKSSFFVFRDQKNVRKVFKICFKK